MKNKYLILLGLFIILSGCTNRRLKSLQREKVKRDIYGTPLSGFIGNYYYEVAVLDSCEYIMINQNLTHKGDCKNPIHRNYYKHQN